MDLTYITALQNEKGGFEFDNYNRNNLFIKSLNGRTEKVGLNFLKTGTTICGCVTQDSVVLGADTRATAGSIVADKECQKLHHLASNIYCAGSGTAADLDHTTLLMESKLELLRLVTHRQPRISAVVSMMSQMFFRYQGHIQCALILGGVDTLGPQLFKIHPHGSTDRLPFCAMGSGSLNALAVLEAGYRDHMSIDEGKTLVSSAIRAGVFNDLGSGGNIDLVVIDGNCKATYLQGYEKPNPRLFRNPKPVVFSYATTPIFAEKTKEVRRSVIVEREDVAMRE